MTSSSSAVIEPAWESLSLAEQLRVSITTSTWLTGQPLSAATGSCSLEAITPTATRAFRAAARAAPAPAARLRTLASQSLALTRHSLSLARHSLAAARAALSLPRALPKAATCLHAVVSHLRRLEDPIAEAGSPPVSVRDQAHVARSLLVKARHCPVKLGKRLLKESMRARASRNPSVCSGSRFVSFKHRFVSLSVAIVRFGGRRGSLEPPGPL